MRLSLRSVCACAPVCARGLAQKATLVSSLSETSLNGYVDLTLPEYRRRYFKNQQLQELYKAKMTSVLTPSEKAAKRHVEVNRKLLVRDRIKLLIDPDSHFLEIGEFAGLGMSYGDVPCAGTVIGIGLINAQRVVIGANDATVKGGTIYPITLRKQLRGQELAAQLRLPCIYLVDSGGAFLPLQAEIFPDQFGGGRIFYNEAIMGADGVPQIAVVCGGCTAGAAYIPTMADDAIIVDKIGSLFLAGPPLVRAALGEQVTAEELGGARIHCRESGCTDYFASTEHEAFSICRDIVACLNPKIVTNPCIIQASAAPQYSQAELAGLAGLQGDNYLQQVLARLLDGSRFLEFRKLFGSAIVTGFGRISGIPVGVVGATCYSGIDSKSALKAAQFVQMCDQRNIPLLLMPNESADPDNRASELDHGTLKSHAQLMTAISNSKVQKITLCLGDCFGSSWFLLGGRAFNSTFVLCWPNFRLSMKNIEKITNTDLADDAAEPGQLAQIRQQLEAESSSWFAASNLWVDKLILPEQTRTVLTQCLLAMNSGLPETGSATANESACSVVYRF